MSQQGSVIDKQTEKVFEVKPEDWVDTLFAWVSIIYTLLAILFLSWLLLETWMGKYPDWFRERYVDSLGQANSPIFKLIIYTAIGGGMGAAVNNIRSFVDWHAERSAFGRRFVWKYISMPPLGAVLAVMVYAIIRGGTAVIAGNPGGGDGGAVTSLSAWVAGALAGYGSHKVLIWLDDKVNTLFKVDAKNSEVFKVPVPDVTGKTRDEAEKTLKAGKLALGDVLEQASDEQVRGKVISQTPAAGDQAAPDSRVSISIGKEMNSQAAKVVVPNLSAKTQEEAAQTLKDGNLVLGDVSTAQATGDDLIGKVISQAPLAGAETAPDTKVAITIGTASDGQAGSKMAKVIVPDVSGKTQEEAAQTLKDGNLALGEVLTGPTTDGQLIDKVISQVPASGTETATDTEVAITLGKAGTV